MKEADVREKKVFLSGKQVGTAEGKQLLLLSRAEKQLRQSPFIFLLSQQGTIKMFSDWSRQENSSTLSL